MKCLVSHGLVFPVLKFVKQWLALQKLKGKHWKEGVILCSSCLLSEVRLCIYSFFLWKGALPWLTTKKVWFFIWLIFHLSFPRSSYVAELHFLHRILFGVLM